MKRALLLLLVAGGTGARTLLAQCPDGSAPPCKSVLTVRPALDSSAVAILPFRVIGQSPDLAWMSEGGMDLFGVALDGLAGWHVISPRTLMPRATHFNEQSTPSVAAGIARSVGAGQFILGRVVGSGSEIVLTAELYQTAGSRRLASATARGGLANPGPIMDSLATTLARQRVSASDLHRFHPAEDYRTASPRALKNYLLAEQLIRRGQWQSAADSLRKAIERDSTFGPAWYQLLRTGWWGGAETGFGSDFNALIRAAMRDTTRLPRRMRFVLRAIEAADRGQRLVSLRRADELLTAYPDDPDAVLAAADNYFHYGLASGEPPGPMVAAFEHAVALDPNVVEARTHLIELLCLLPDTTRAWRVLKDQLELTPKWANMRLLGVAMRAVFRAEDPELLVSQLSENDISAHGGLLPLYSLLCGRSDPAHAVAIADSFTAVVASSDRTRTLHVTATARLHDFYVARGRYREAWDVLQKATAVEPARFESLGRVILHHLIVGDRASEAREAGRHLAGQDGTPVILLLWFQTAVGSLDSTAAQKIYGGSFLMREDMTPYRTALLAGLQGLSSLRVGDSIAARQLFLRAYEARYPNLMSSTWAKPDRRFTLALARLEFASGDLEAAARHLQDLMFPEGLLERAEAEELLAQIEVQRADTAAAVHAYHNFIALWQNADPELQPRVTAARVALVRLERR